MPECYIRGSTIKYLRIPDEVIDMVKEDIQMKSRGRGEMKGRGQNQRGRSGGRGNGLALRNYKLYTGTLSFFQTLSADTFFSYKKIPEYFIIYELNESEGLSKNQKETSKLNCILMKDILHSLSFKK